MAKQEAMSFMEFKNKFSSEDVCRDYLFHLRWHNGFKCPKCGNGSYYTITTRNLYECTSCHYQASVTVGTIMEGSHIKLEKCFWGIYFISTDKRGCSALRISKELEISYKAAWYMLQRVRTAIMERDWDYMLSGVVELDEAYFGAPDEGGNRGRGTSKTKVIVGLSLSDMGHPLFLKMETANDLSAETISEFAEANIKPDSTISSNRLVPTSH